MTPAERHLLLSCFPFLSFAPPTLMRTHTSPHRPRRDFWPKPQKRRQTEPTRQSRCKMADEQRRKRQKMGGGMIIQSFCRSPSPLLPRSEKDALETTLFEIQQHLAQLETRKEQLEAERQGLLHAKEALQGILGGRSSFGSSCATPVSFPSVTGCGIADGGFYHPTSPADVPAFKLCACPL